MKKTRLIELLKTFSVQEIKDFEKFIASPYFSRGRNLKPLFAFIKKNYPDFHSPSFTRENIFIQLFPGKKFDKQKSTHLLNVNISELTLLAEKFMAIEQLQNENRGYEIYNALNRTFKNRHLDKYRMKLILSNIERIQNSGTDIHFQELIDLNIDLSSLYFIENNRRGEYECIEKMQLFTYGYYLWAWGRIVNDYFALSLTPQNLKNIESLKIGIQNFVPEVFENEFYDDGLGNKQLIMADYYSIKAQLEIDDEESLLTAIAYYKANFEKFIWSVKSGFFRRLINICVQRALRGNEDKKFFLLGSELVDFALNNQIYGSYEGGPLMTGYFILYFGFKNNVLYASELEAFTERTLKLVENDSKQFLTDYCYVWINFKKRDYPRTIEIIAKMGTLPKALKFMMGKIKIASLYSLNYIEEAIYNLDSYEHFIRSSIKSENRDDRDMSFIKTFKLFINCKTHKIPFDEGTIKKTIEESKLSILRPWFLEEADKLKKEFMKQ